MTGDESGDLTGRRLGNYRIDGVLGRGGMSVMYKATDVRLGRKVALKVIGEHLGADAEFRERFVDEARNTSAIDHANIVPLYDFGDLDGMLYIAMRLVDGSDLGKLIGGSPMEPERAFGLLEQVGDALDTLHGRGFVHLDVKPANVLVTSRESQREHVYVADFGLTRRGATGHRTRGGDFLGSPTYAAPEHLRGEPLDGRTDQYALACMLYACLTGAPPFQGDVQTVIKGHLGGEAVPVARRVPALPASIDDVVRTGMAKAPDERYATCVALIQAARDTLESSQQATTQSQAPPQSANATRTTVPGRQPVAVSQQGEGGPVQPFGQQPGQQGQPGPGPQGQPGYQSGYQQGPPPGFGQQPGQGQQGQPGFPPQQGGAPYGTPPHGLGMPPQQPPHYPAPSGYPQQLPGQPPQQGGPGFPPGAPPPPKKGGKAWLWLLALGVVLVAGVIVAVVLLTGGEDEGGGGTGETTSGSTAPEIPVGPGGSAGNEPGETSGGEAPPTSIPVVPDSGG